MTGATSDRKPEKRNALYIFTTIITVWYKVYFEWQPKLVCDDATSCNQK